MIKWSWKTYSPYFEHRHCPLICICLSSPWRDVIACITAEVIKSLPSLIVVGLFGRLSNFIYNQFDVGYIKMHTVLCITQNSYHCYLPVEMGYNFIILHCWNKQNKSVNIKCRCTFLHLLYSFCLMHVYPSICNHACLYISWWDGKWTDTLLPWNCIRFLAYYII